LQTEIRQRYATLDAELDRLRHDMLAESQRQAEQIRAEARTATERERDIVRSRLAHLQEAQQEHLAAAIAAATGAAVERLLRQIGGPDLDQRLAGAACRTLQALSGEALGSVTVESAHPLDQETQTALATELGEAARTTAFRVTSTLGAGIRISTNQGLVDASAAGLAAFARRVLAEQLGTLPNGPSSAPAGTPKETPYHA
jgi:F0F1-type ATP synthase delta subunit